MSDSISLTLLGDEAYKSVEYRGFWLYGILRGHSACFPMYILSGSTSGPWCGGHSLETERLDYRYEFVVSFPLEMSFKCRSSFAEVRNNEKWEGNSHAEATLTSTLVLLTPDRIYMDFQAHKSALPVGKLSER